MRIHTKLSVFFVSALTAASTGAVLSDETWIRGEVLGQGAPCVQFRIDGGETISLQGASPQEFQQGMRLKLSGQWLRVSNCMQGRAFRVDQHSAL
jgi:hypothetical protein